MESLNTHGSWDKIPKYDFRNRKGSLRSPIRQPNKESALQGAGMSQNPGSAPTSSFRRRGSSTMVRTPGWPVQGVPGRRAPKSPLGRPKRSLRPRRGLKDRFGRPNGNFGARRPGNPLYGPPGSPNAQICLGAFCLLVESRVRPDKPGDNFPEQ